VRGRGSDDPFRLPREAVRGSWGPDCVLTLCGTRRGSLYANAQTRALYTNALNGDHPENLVSEPAERTEVLAGWVESPSMQVSVAGSTGVEAGAQHSGELQAFIGAGGQRPEELQPLREPERRARSR
jgi:hypothetical protein